MLKSVLWLLHRCASPSSGRSHVKFIQYRPVLSNDKLKSEFGFTPHYDAREVFDRYREGRAERET